MHLFLAASNPIEHVVDKPLVGILSMNIVTMAVVAALLVWTMKVAADAIATGPESQGNERYITKGVFSQMIEVVVLALRDFVIRPQLGADTNRFLPYLLTLFFFILYNNLVGLMPLLDLWELLYSILGIHHSPLAKPWVGGTATANIAVTGALAFIAFLVIHISAVRKIGVGAWLKHLTADAPWYIWPIMIPVEIMGTFIKPFALAVRLFANMTAGHTLLATLLMFTGMSFAALGVLGGTTISVVSVIASVPLMFLELLVAFIQAFIFMFLTVVFIAQFLHHEHDDHAMAEAYEPPDSAETDRAAPVSA